MKAEAEATLCVQCLAPGFILSPSCGVRRRHDVVFTAGNTENFVCTRVGRKRGKLKALLSLRGLHRNCLRGVLLSLSCSLEFLRVVPSFRRFYHAHF